MIGVVVEKCREIGGYRFFAAILCVLICCFYLLIGAPHYDTNDDVTHNFIVIGNYGEQHSARLPFSNILYGELFTVLYNAIGSINWYGVFPIGLSIVCFAFIGYVFAQRWQGAAGIIFPVLFTLFFGETVVINYQFTHLAAFFSACGLFFMYTALLEEKKYRVNSYIGVFITLVGYWIRRDSCMSVAAIAGVCMLVRVIKERFWKLRVSEIVKHILPFALLLVLIAGSEMANRIANDDPDWEYWSEYNTYRASLLDYPMPEYDLYEKEYLELGIDRQDFDLFCSWNYADQNKFSLETLKGMYELQQRVRTDDFSLMAGLERFVKDIDAACDDNLAFLFILAVSVLLLFLKRENWWIILPLCMFLAEMFYLSYVGRFIYRSYVGLWMIVGLMVFWMCMPAVSRLRGRHVVSVLAAIAVVMLPEFYDVWLEHYDINRDIRTQMQNYEFKETLASDESSMYVSETITEAFPETMSPFAMPPKYNHNQYCMGGWTCPSPLQQDLLDKYGLEDGIMQGLVDDSKNVFYVEGQFESWRSRLLHYLRKEYDEDIQVECVDYISSVYVYRFYIDKARSAVDVRSVERAYQLDRAEKTDRIKYDLALSKGDKGYHISGWCSIEEIDPYKQNVWLKVTSPEEGKTLRYIRGQKQIVSELVEKTGEQHSAASGILFDIERRYVTGKYDIELIIESNETIYSTEITDILND